eukprot:684511-Rhodomonas_salina.2
MRSRSASSVTSPTWLRSPCPTSTARLWTRPSMRRPCALRKQPRSDAERTDARGRWASRGRVCANGVVSECVCERVLCVVRGAASCAVMSGMWPSSRRAETL